MAWCTMLAGNPTLAPAPGPWLGAELVYVRAFHLGDPVLDPHTLDGGGAQMSGGYVWPSGLGLELQLGAHHVANHWTREGQEVATHQTLFPVLVGGRYVPPWPYRLKLFVAAHAGLIVTRWTRAMLGTHAGQHDLHPSGNMGLGALWPFNRHLRAGVSAWYGVVWNKDNAISGSNNGQLFSLGATVAATW